MSYPFNQSRAFNQNDEPIYLSKFILTMVLPQPLREIYGPELITEQVRRIGGLETDKLPEAVEQGYRFDKRRYLGGVPDTNVDIEMEFEVNRDASGAMYPYNIFRDWAKIGYDFNTGFQGVKEDYIGSATIQMHDKAGQVLREWFCRVIFPIVPPNAMDLEYLNEAIYTLTLTFAAEDVADTSI